MGLAVAENKIEIAVLVQVELVNALQYTSPRNVEIVATVAEAAAP